MTDPIHVRLDDIEEGKAALQDLLRLASTNIADAHETPGSMGTETEITAIINEWRADPERLWHRVAWFGMVAGATAAAAAWCYAREGSDDEPTDDEAMDALRDLERAIEELLSP